MKALFFKEIRSFLNSLAGYIAILVFLITTGLFMWYFQMATNVLDYGEASLQSLFFTAPFVFLFLIPAITMKSFSEEKKNGTIELLLTKPITDTSIIMAKYLAGVVLVIFSLLPTLVYYYSVVQLGDPVGNIDHAGTWGSYIGLLLLGCTFLSIGIFASSITRNQIIAFLLGVLICFVVFIGFQFFADSFTAPYDLFFIKLSVQEHYISMQKGVIDSRDVLYYFSVILVFLFFTRVSLQSRFW
ncbi:MAG: ABC-2 type transport system permease protein [Saprospiraceae bacterium]|jgi:ABC-2 type transport system permease protein